MKANSFLSHAAHEGLTDKIALIRRYYEESLSRPAVRALAEQAVLSGGAKNLPAAFRYLKERVRYVPDPVGAEYIKAPWVAVGDIEERGWTAGDCDDFASLSYALLRNVGVPAVLTVGWYGDKNPRHIWTRVPFGVGFVDFDLTAPRFGVTRISDLVRVENYA